MSICGYSDLNPSRVSTFTHAITSNLLLRFALGLASEQTFADASSRGVHASGGPEKHLREAGLTC